VVKIKFMHRIPDSAIRRVRRNRELPSALRLSQARGGLQLEEPGPEVLGFGAIQIARFKPAAQGQGA
jgi:hypothetical protein